MGLSLLGLALGETLIRWNYQSQQERALERGPAVSVPAEEPAIEVSPRVIEFPAFEQTSEAPTTAVTEPLEREAKPPQRAEKKPRTATIDPDAFGRLEIPRIGVAAIVKEGDDERTLSRAVGLLRGSARPGEPGNMVLAGHRDTFFRPLRKIKVNDRIRMIVPPNTYEYEVQSLRVVAPEETSVLASNGIEELTLVTCYPFRYLGPAPDRFIVSATRVN
ncbi:MAG: class D sortase [Acidobacteriota bacterium]|nr:class D sortase [Acidobacteriota bacterium]